MKYLRNFLFVLSFLLLLSFSHNINTKKVNAGTPPPPNSTDVWGWVNNPSPSGFTMMNSSNVPVAITFASSTTVTINNQPATVNDLKSGMNGVAKGVWTNNNYLGVTASSIDVSSTDVWGFVNNVSPSGFTIVNSIASTVITVSSSTTVSINKVPATLADLKNGLNGVVRGVWTNNNYLGVTASSIDVSSTDVWGWVNNPSPTGFTMMNSSNVPIAITFASSTTVTINGQPATVNDLKNGMNGVAKGVWTNNNYTAVTASTITVSGAEVWGSISNLTSNSFTVISGGQPIQITTNSSTVVTINNQPYPFSYLQNGMSGSVTGTWSGNNYTGVLAENVKMSGTIQVGTIPFVMQGLNPSDYRVTVFATGLSYPYGMVALENGDLLVGSSVPQGGRQVFSNALGQALLLSDTNHDGIADSGATTLVSGLQGMVTGLRQVGDLMIISSGIGAGSNFHHEIGFYQKTGAAYTKIGSVDLAVPSPWWHTASALQVRPTGDPNQFDLFFNIGSQDNIQPSVASMTATGLLDTTLLADSIYKVTVNHSQGSGLVSLNNLTRVAKGLRNAYGMAFDPAGNLYLEDNGIDGPGANGDPSTSLDELNMIPAADIGNVLYDFGFPNCYVTPAGTVVGGAGCGTQPVITYPPLNGHRTEGPSEITFLPSSFPNGLGNVICVGFMGVVRAAGAANNQNGIACADPANPAGLFHLVESGTEGVGHLIDFATTSNTLFIADFSSDGQLFGGNTGVIYAITPIGN